MTAAAALGTGLRVFSEHILFPEQHELQLIGQYEALAWILPLVWSAILLVLIRDNRWIGVALLAGSAFGHVYIILAISGPIFLTSHPFYAGPPTASLTLGVARPTSSGPHTPLLLSKYDADEMNRRRLNDQFTYVPPDVPSTGPNVVSVNPIDDENWTGAALAADGYCGLFLLVTKPPNAYGHYGKESYYGRLPPGQPCVAAVASRQTVTARYPSGAGGGVYFPHERAAPIYERYREPLLLNRFTAAELNRTRRGSQYTHITYIPANEPSTGPQVISVNPIDEHTWGAAALSLRGYCDLILTTANPDDRGTPRPYRTYYGVLPQGEPCLGTAATRETVTSTVETTLRR